MIINIQQTTLDDIATLRIFEKADMVFESLLRSLGLLILPTKSTFPTTSVNQITPKRKVHIDEKCGLSHRTKL